MGLHKFSLQDLILKGRGERVLKTDKERERCWRGEGVVWEGMVESEGDGGVGGDGEGRGDGGGRGEGGVEGGGREGEWRGGQGGGGGSGGQRQGGGVMQGGKEGWGAVGEEGAVGEGAVGEGWREGEQELTHLSSSSPVSVHAC